MSRVTERERRGGNRLKKKKKKKLPFYTRLNPIFPTKKSSHSVYTFSMGFLWATIKTID